MKKIFVGIAMVLVIAIISGASYLKFGLPDVGNAPDLKVNSTSERIARGKYLAYHVTLCMDCHSTRNWQEYSGPMVPGTSGKGGEYFGPEVGFPGKFYSKNITPFHLKDWTDGDIFRAISTGVSKDGSTLFPVMPYLYYGKMDKEDIYDIIAFVRTLQPIDNKPPDHSVDFPMNFIINTIPEKPSFTTLPPKSDTIAYGSYMVNAAGCMECHTPVSKGQIIKSEEFTGGRDFKLAFGTTYSANITPDDETGIGGWPVDQFVSRFKAYDQPGGTPTVTNDEPQTIMPWAMYGGMDTTDLVAIYKYLKTLKPVKHKVEHFVPNSVAKK